MHAVALLLVLTLAGPSVGALVCDWMCATKHEESTSTGNCHESPAKGSMATLEAGHRCHDVNSATASILPTCPQVELRAMPVVAALTDQVRASALALIDGRSPGPPHAPPPLLIPLRL